MIRLFVLSGADLGRSFDVGPGAVIGRNPDCEVQLRDASISRRHARVVFESGGWRVLDEGSRNGLWSGGAKQAEVALADGGEFKVGDVAIRARIEAGAAPEIELEDAVAPRAKVAAPAPELDEIVLEESPSAPAPSAPPRAPLAATQLAATPIARRGVAASPSASPGLERRGDRVLQYHKVDGASGAFGAELAQRSLAVRASIYVAMIALFGLLAWGAFKATSFLKARALGDAPQDASEADEPAR